MNNWLPGFTSASGPRGRYCSRQVRAGFTPGWTAGGIVLPDDIRAVCHGVFRHRLKLTYDASADGVSANDVIDGILRQVAVA